MLETLKSLILDVWNVDVIMKGICEMTHMDDAEIFMTTLIRAKKFEPKQCEKAW